MRKIQSLYFIIFIFGIACAGAFANPIHVTANRALITPSGQCHWEIVLTTTSKVRGGDSEDEISVKIKTDGALDESDGVITNAQHDIIAVAFRTATKRNRVYLILSDARGNLSVISDLNSALKTVCHSLPGLDTSEIEVMKIDRNLITLQAGFTQKSYVIQVRAWPGGRLEFLLAK